MKRRALRATAVYDDEARPHTRAGLALYPAREGASATGHAPGDVVRRDRAPSAAASMTCARPARVSAASREPSGGSCAPPRMARRSRDSLLPHPIVGESRSPPRGSSGGRSGSSPGGRCRCRCRRWAACRARARGRSPRRRAASPRRPAASSARCCSKRARCSSGSFSSVKAFANSIPPAKALEALHQARLGAVVLRERRQLLRVVEDERRALEVGLDVLGEQVVHPLRPGALAGQLVVAGDVDARSSPGSPRAASAASRGEKSIGPS